ncbi:MAG TPA: WhiB family transcriptional regulator [Actinophytocola sp.]
MWELLNLGAPDETEWMRSSACAQTDPEAFFPERGQPNGSAKSVCQGCPVRTACLEYALARNERRGVWGGLSGRERRQLARARYATVASVEPDRRVA